jgi:hypothetical protein
VPGVVIAQGTSVTSSSDLVSAASIEAIGALLKYSIILTNNTEQPILAYSVCWTTPDSEGIAQREYYMSFEDLKGRALLPPGRSDIVSVLGQLSHVKPGDLNHLAANAATQASKLNDLNYVTIQLDSLVLADGSTIGPDRSRLGLRAAARIFAERDLLTAITSGGLSNDQINALLTDLEAYAKPGSKVNIGTFQTRYVFEKSRLAAELLRQAASQTVPVMLERARTTLASRNYPAAMMARYQ